MKLSAQQMVYLQKMTNRTEQNRMQTNLVVRFLTQQVGRLTYSHQGHSLHVQDDVICKDFCCEFTVL